MPVSYLVDAGYAVFNYDKRGVDDSDGQFTEVGVETAGWRLPELADDAVAAAAFVRGLDEIDPASVGLMGGSQAGWVNPLAASRSDDLAFVVMRFLAVRRFGDEETGVEASRCADRRDEPCHFFDRRGIELDMRGEEFVGENGFVSTGPVAQLRHIQSARARRGHQQAGLFEGFPAGRQPPGESAPFDFEDARGLGIGQAGEHAVEIFSMIARVDPSAGKHPSIRCKHHARRAPHHEHLQVGAVGQQHDRRGRADRYGLRVEIVVHGYERGVA